MLELFEKTNSTSLSIVPNKSRIYLSNSLPRDFRIILESGYQLGFIESELSVDPKAICIVDKAFLSQHSFDFLEGFQFPLIYVGEELAEIPSNCFFLPWESREEIKDLLKFFNKFSAQQTQIYRDLKKDKEFFIKHLFSLCLNNQRLNLEDRRWLQDAVVLSHANLLIVGSLDELVEIISKIEAQLKPNLSKLRFRICETEMENIDLAFRYGFPYRGKFYQLEADFSNNDFAAAVFFFTLAKTTELVLSFFHRTNSLAKRWKILHNLVQEIPFPLILLSSDAELIFHNKEFDQLELIPKDSLKLESGEMKSFSGRHFRIEKNVIQYQKEILYLITFFRQETKEKDEQLSSSEELGIISSSIAHELNNPVAGILAAVALLELDEELDLQDLSKVAEIKSSARRIKQLVNIFLGFSRGRMSESRQASLQDCLCRAFDLLRYRMAEMNANLEFEFESLSSFKSRKVNESIYSMVLYLICSEILNISSHAKLIENGPCRLDKLKVLEEERYFSLTIEESKKVYERLLEQKLCIHLLQLEGIKLSLQEKRLLLYFPLES